MNSIENTFDILEGEIFEQKKIPEQNNYNIKISYEFGLHKELEEEFSYNSNPSKV